MDKNLKLPYNKRYKFAKPLGNLIAGTREGTLLEIENDFRSLAESGVSFNFFLVGDIVTKDFLSNSFLKDYIKLCIIDEKTQRKHININNEDFFEEIIEFKNPAGIIAKESWFLLKKIIDSGKRTLLKIVEGEEDLLVIPLTLTLTVNEKVKNIVFYGQPPITDSDFKIPEGIVLVEINEGILEKVKSLLDILERF